MEQLKKKEELLQEVEYTNLLSLTLVEGKLERNFRAIVEALRLAQSTAEQAKVEAQQAHHKTNQLESLLEQHKQQYARDHQVLASALGELGKTQPSLTQAPRLENAIEGKSEQQNHPEPSISLPSQQPFPLLATDNKDLVSKKEFQDLVGEVKSLKENMPSLDFMEQEMKQTKKDLTALRAELKALSHRRQAPSTTRRDTNTRRESASKPQTRASIAVKTGSSGLLPDLHNKENQPSQQQQPQTKEELTSNHRVATPKETHSAQGEASSFDHEGLQMEVNTLGLCLDELKGYVEELRKRDIRVTSALVDLQKKDKELCEQLNKDTERLQCQIKNIKITTLVTPPSQNAPENEKSKEREDSDVKKEEKNTKVEKEKGERTERAQRQKRVSEIVQPAPSLSNDIVVQLQSALAEAVTDSQFQRFKQEVRTKFAELEGVQGKLAAEHEEDVKKLEDMFIERDIEAKRLNEGMTQLEQQAKEAAAQVERKHNIAIARIQEVKKGLQNLREDMQFYQSLLTDKEKGTDGKKEAGQSGAEVPQVDSKAIEDLKRHTHNKLHDQRAYLVGLIRDLEKKMQAASSVNQQIANIWDKTNQINLLMGRKADNEDMKKQMGYLEKKMAKVLTQLSKPDDTEDARVARTNWYCLSCDKNLMSYQGKVGKHVVWDTMPLKGVVKGLDKKSSLPSLKVKL